MDIAKSPTASKRPKKKKPLNSKLPTHWKEKLKQPTNITINDYN